MSHGKSASGLALIGGSAVGAALMYLFDPEKGEKRREYLRSHTEDALRSATRRVTGTWHDMADHARDLGNRLSDHATHLADHAGDLKDSTLESASGVTQQLAGHVRQLGKAIADKAQEYASHASEYTQQAKDYATGAGDYASSKADDYRSRARGYAGRLRDRAMSYGESQHSSHAAEFTMTAAGVAALGLGAMWFMNREHGEERRQMVLGKATEYLNETGSAFRSSGQYLARHVNSLIAEVKHHFDHGRDAVAELSSNPGGTYGAPEGGNASSGSGAGGQAGEAPILSFDRSHSIRLGIGVAGGALGFYGATRRDWLGMGVGLLGLSMAACGLTAIDYHALNDRARRYGSTLGEKAGDLGNQARDLANKGAEAAKGLTSRAGLTKPTSVSASVEVAVPVERVFEFWTNYANFPSFMSNVREVTDTGEGRSHWVAKGPAGVNVSWDATETQRIQNELLSWESVPGSTIDTRGTVRFQPIGDDQTRIDVELSYTPPAGQVGHTIAKLMGADPGSEINQDLQKLKTKLESGAKQNA